MDAFSVMLSDRTLTVITVSYHLFLVLIHGADTN